MGANLHEHCNLMPTVIKSRCHEILTVVNKMSVCFRSLHPSTEPFQTAYGPVTLTGIPQGDRPRLLIYGNCHGSLADCGVWGRGMFEK